MAGIEGKTLGDKLVSVTVGSKSAGKPVVNGQPQPFASVPYKFKTRWRTARRARGAAGFKFALISGLAAYIANAGEILIPESGQGAIGPALVVVSHAYPDYRNHPLFTIRMACFLKALLGRI